jgi:hypothetical protein
VIWADLPFDRIECLQRYLFGALDARSCWSPQSSSALRDRQCAIAKY